MKYAVLFASGAALALSACQKSEAPAPEASATAEATEAAAATPAAAAPAGAAVFTAGQPPSKDFMVGIWGEGEACSQPIDFQADGTIKDGPFDKWTLDDGELVMGDLVKMKLTVVDEKTMEAVREGDSEKTILKRCG